MKIKGLIPILYIVFLIALIALNISLYRGFQKIRNQPPKVEYVEIIKEVELVPDNDFMTYLGVFTLTAYCPCPQCCGNYANNRPQVGNREVVVTSSGSFAEQGITIAVDPKVIPYGTKIYIEGLGVRVAQDCGGAIKANKIDVYFLNHEEALQFGVKKLKVWLVNENVFLFS